MKSIFPLILICFVLHNLGAQNSLSWSDYHPVDLRSPLFDTPQLQLDQDTLQVFGVSSNKNDDFAKFKMLKYDTLGNLFSEIDYASEQSDTTASLIIAWELDQEEHPYLLKWQTVGYNKQKAVFQKFNPSGSIAWEKEIFSPQDTSYTAYSLGLLQDSLLLVSVEKTFDYALNPTDPPQESETRLMLFAYHTNGDKLWDIELAAGEMIDFDFRKEMLAYKNSWLVFGKKSFNEFTILKVHIDGSYSIAPDFEELYSVDKAIISRDSQLLIRTSGGYKMYKITEQGEIIWSYKHPTNLPQNVSGDQLEDLVEDDQGNIYISGKHHGEGHGTPVYTNGDVLTIKLDSEGNVLWEDRYVYEVNNFEGTGVLKYKDGFVYVGGRSGEPGTSSFKDFLVLKIDATTGERIGEYRYGALNFGDERVTDLAVLESGSLAFTGVAEKFFGEYFWATQFLAPLKLNNQKLRKQEAIQVYPNPISKLEPLVILNKAAESCQLFSLLGENVLRANLRKNSKNYIDLSGLTSGVYFLSFQNGERYATKKIIIL